MSDREERIEQLERAVVAVVLDRGVGHLSNETQRLVAAAMDPIEARKYVTQVGRSPKR